VNRSVEFFDAQFQRQVASGDFALNPFETLALPFAQGRVLDLGCGLGNLANVAGYRIAGDYDTIVAIGLLMLMPCRDALGLLSGIRQHVAPGGVAIINLLVEGTTYRDMFEPRGYCLFGGDEIERRLASWKIELSRHDSFEAPGGTKKAFSTVIARRP
jgi:tellurite methyltransferase